MTKVMLIRLIGDHKLPCEKDCCLGSETIFFYTCTSRISTVLLISVLHFCMEPRFIEKEPCLLSEEDHSCCCECDGCNDEVENPDRTSRPYFKHKKLEKGQLLVAKPGILYTSKRRKKKGKPRLWWIFADLREKS